ncbi:MAG: extracellular solute-binding protein [Chloroflexi bacterium]|nr:extracellular solute-binding protein [Chloroflexota bacterium]
MDYKLSLMAAVCFSFISFSCVSAQPPAAVIEAPATKPGEAAVSQEAWERDWQRTIDAARAEGGLTVYTSGPPELRQAQTRGLKDKFGLDIEWVAAKSTQVAEKLLKERRAGLYIADVFQGGSIPQIQLFKPAGILEPLRPLLVLPEVVDATAWQANRLPFIDKEQSYVISPMLSLSGYIVINTTMVKPEDVSSIDSLLEPRWKGKILIGDPTTGVSTAIKTFQAIYMSRGPEFWRKFAENSPLLLRDDRLAAEWVARSKYPIFWMIEPANALELMKAGAPLKATMPRDGGYLSVANPVSFMNSAPHPNAAKVFINWALSKEGSYTVSRVQQSQTARLDVPTDHLSPDDLYNPSRKYVDGGAEEFILESPAYIEKAKEVFAALLK